MFKKVLMVLPYRLDFGAEVQQVDYIYQSYLKKLTGINLLPVLCPSHLPKNMIESLYEECDGILLMGGADINPSIYSQDIESHTKVNNPLRDESESFVINLAFRDKKPLLGICRGMQIVNCVFGGSLHQHLPDLILGEEHFIDPKYHPNRPPSYDDVATDREQFMIVRNGSLLAEIVGGGKHLIHCAHHQSINLLAPNLLINAESEAGVIEGLELSDRSHFVLLLQSHIETQDNDLSSKIWDKFADSVQAF